MHRKPHAGLATRVGEKSEAEGVSIEHYIEGLIVADQAAEEELEALALEALRSGPAIEVGADYWENKHRQVDERLQRAKIR
jgi:hypothetical protein